MKRYLSVLLVAIMLLTMVSGLTFSASAESLYIRKIVSLVCDDSGSMDGVKWGYANYALQAFCGMLNSEDQLFITYMNASEKNGMYSPESVDLSAGGIQSSINGIRNHNAKGGTPFASVEAAFSKLQSVQDSNPNTQYWLVVITDGAFGGFTNTTESFNAKFAEYTNTVMPNGTKPQVTFMAIGDQVNAPSANAAAGIYVERASDASGIQAAMSNMADRISGRTRLDSKKDIIKVDSNTIQVSSSIPLLNIAVLSQNSDAKITQVTHSSGANIPIGRQASMSYTTYVNLYGSAYLIGDSQTVIEEGSYTIQFSEPVEIDNLVVLYEPALEVRMTITVNGAPISDLSELNNVHEGDKICVSCAIYEMGTSKQIDPALLPGQTTYEISILEDGSVMEQATGANMELKDYVLKQVQTQIKASVCIEGFNPIESVVIFTPAEYVPPIVYTINADFGSDVKSVKMDHISTNQDLTICFTIFADGVAITDPATVQALNPVITVSPQGNDGSIIYESDGRIVFTPNTATAPAVNNGSFDVDVTCALPDGTTASCTYTVLISQYAAVAVPVTDPIVKTRFFGNQVGASFYITKDGVQLDKAAVEKHISVLVNEEYAHLKTQITVAPDGMITVTPVTEEEHVLTFWNWWVNWKYYFGLEGTDLEITLNHAYGQAKTTIDVTGESVSYLVWKVYAPLILEILLIAAIIAYIVRYITKPRFASNAVLYVGSITRSMSKNGVHLMELREVHLKPFNKFKNLWNPFKELTVSANGVKITAVKGSRIRCEEPFPWYSDGITPKQKTLTINSPKDVVNYCLDKDEIEIQEIKPTAVMDAQNAVISQDESVYYFVRASVGYVGKAQNQMEVIEDAIALCYSTVQN